MRANFTPRTQEILSLAKKLAEKFFHKKIELEHVLLSFLKVDSFVLPFIQSKLNISFEYLEKTIAESLNDLETQKEELDNFLKFSKEVQSCLDFCINLSASKQHSYISSEHLLYAMLNDLNSNIIDYFIMCDIDIIKVQEILEYMLSEEVVHNPSLFTEHQSDANLSSNSPFISNKTSLDQFSVNLNLLAKDGEFDFIAPNSNYINRLEETLCRKTKSCALLVGDAGVGKTALVEGLSKRIINLECNDYLISKKILSLDLSAMVAGTKYRGQFEERLKSFIDEARVEKNIILFIDEIHTIVGAGNSEGALDAANILKPYLARGEITCIGSTTHQEYKKSFAKDPALKRRFDVIKISEPTPEECFDILKNLIPSYASFHNVGYDLHALHESISLSCKYIHNKQLPDKAIDLLDQAGAALKISHYKKPKIAKNMEKVLTSDTVEMSVKNDLYENYKKIIEKWGKKKQKKFAVVTPEHIRSVISKNLEIPIESLNETHSKKLLELEKRMSKDVVGQSDAITQISNCLFKTHCGLKDFDRPIGSFLFLGKTGVGKTLTAKSLAKNYFGSSKKLIYFDMSEFSESVSVSKFSGSSPGYVGYEQGGILTEKIKRDPHSVLLFDEIEKAHPIVMQSLLQILEEGRMTDSSGEETSFKNTIIILTSNLGADIIDKHGSVGFLSDSYSTRDKILEEAKKTLSPELINRFDGIVMFNNFSSNEIRKIINIELGKVRKKLKARNIAIKFSSLVQKEICKRTISENLGGRPVRRIIQNELEVALSKFIIHNSDCKSVNITFKDNQFVCNEFKR